MSRVSLFNGEGKWNVAYFIVGSTLLSTDTLQVYVFPFIVILNIVLISLIINTLNHYVNV